MTLAGAAAQKEAFPRVGSLEEMLQARARAWAGLWGAGGGHRGRAGKLDRKDEVTQGGQRPDREGSGGAVGRKPREGVVAWAWGELLLHLSGISEAHGAALIETIHLHDGGARRALTASPRHRAAAITQSSFFLMRCGH